MKEGDKVVCIDDSPRPYRIPKGLCGDDFSFPQGFVVKDRIYCITHVFPRMDQAIGVRVAGKPILFGETEVEWSSQRLRKVQQRSESVKVSAEIEETADT